MLRYTECRYDTWLRHTVKSCSCCCIHSCYLIQETAILSLVSLLSLLLKDVLLQTCYSNSLQSSNLSSQYPSWTNWTWFGKIIRAGMQLLSLGFIVEVHYVCIINAILIIKYCTVTHDVKKILPRSEGCGGIIIALPWF